MTKSQLKAYKAGNQKGRRWWLVVCPTAQDVGSFYSVRERAEGNAKFYQHDVVEVVEVVK